MRVPLIDLVAQYKNIKPQIDEAMMGVVSSGCFVLGEEVSRLERKLATYCDTKYAVGVSSGTDALRLGLMAYDIGPGDEVITTPFTFVATVDVICNRGATPVFVDIDPETCNMDTSKLEAAITDRTKAIIPVHIYGQAVDMTDINRLAKEYNLRVIEDACQAVGAEQMGRKVCSMGDMGALSFFPSKNLGCYGDGGMILTSNKDLYQKLQALRVHGATERYYHSYVGTNARLDAIQAAVLNVKMEYIADWTCARERCAMIYMEQLEGIDAIRLPVKRAGNTHVYNQFTLQVKDRDKLRESLAEQEIDTAIHYPIPLHLQPALAYLKTPKGLLPVAEKVASEVVSLPIFPEMTNEQLCYVAQAVKKHYGK